MYHERYGFKVLSLNNKERSLLEYQKKQEMLCVKKYQSFAAQAKDPQLAKLFSTLAGQEQQHLESIDQLLGGNIPAADGGQGGGMPQLSGQAVFPPLQSSDADMCEDLLATEKYVSSAYNTAIFEFRDPAVRQVLNHIQKEEQQRGERLYAYMAAQGMY